MKNGVTIILFLVSLSDAVIAFQLQRSIGLARYNRHIELYYTTDPDEKAPSPHLQHDIFPKDVFELKEAADIDDVDFQLYKESTEKEYSLASTLNVTDVESNHHDIQVIGHRGSPYTALENTLRGFVHAAQAGAHGVELDVFLLKCGTLVVFHGSGGDEEPGLLHSYCGVEGSILDYTAEEARNLLRFNKHFEEFGCGPNAITHPEDDNHYCFVHTLEEVLLALHEHMDVTPDFTVKIELKGEGTAFPTVELARKLKLMHRCHYSSFDHSRIAEVRELEPTATTGALFANDVPHDFIDRALRHGADEIHFKYDTCSYERVQAAHNAGLGTMAWFRGPARMKEDHLTKYFDVGNEDVEMYKTVLRSGVQSLCVNKPDVMVKALEELTHERRKLPHIFI